MKAHTLSTISLTLVTLLAACAANAREAPQSATKTGVGDDEEMGGEIIVTAQRREERLQDVPISVSVTTGAQLKSLRLDNLSDIRYVTPGFTFTDKSKTANQGASLRGLGTVALLSNGVEQSVGTVIDGVVIGRAQGSSPDLVDIERVEVLRGPQGTLFGKNSSAGVINIVTRDPSFERAYDFSATYGSRNDVRLESVINTPLTDDAALRVAGYYFRRDGFVTNLFDDKKYHNRNVYGGRFKLLLKPTQQLDILLSGDFSKRDDDCCNHLPNKRAAAGIASRVPGSIAPEPFNTTINVDTLPSNRTDIYGASLTMNYDLGRHVLTSVSAFRSYWSFDTIDSDGLPVPVVQTNSNDTDWDQTSQEFRLTSEATRRLSYVVGLFYFQQTLQATSLQIGTLAWPPVKVSGQQFTDRVSSESYAAFGQGTFRVTDQFRLIGGARYTDEKISEIYILNSVPGTALWPRAAVGRISGSVKASNVSWKAGAQFDMTPDIMFYGTYSTGYKGPAINPFLNKIDVTKQEDARSYEAGAKAVFFSGRFNVNIVAFDTLVKGFQANVTDFSINPPLVRIVNAGSVKSRGFEVDFNGRLAPGLSVFGGVSYAKTRFGEFGRTPCYAFQTVAQGCIGGFFDPSGNIVPNAPDWTATTTARYETELASTVTGFVQVSWVYKSVVNFLLNTDPSTRQPGYSLFDSSVGAQTANGKYRVALFVKNVFDKGFLTGISPQTQDGPGGYFHYISLDAQRTMGVTLQMKY